MTCSRTEARSGARISSVFGSAVFKWVGTWSFLLPEPFLALPQSGGSGELEILVFTEKHLVEHWKCSLIICCWIFLFKTTAVVRANCTRNFIIISSIHAQATESGLCVWSLNLDVSTERCNVNTNLNFTSNSSLDVLTNVNRSPCL